ncbi:MAG: PKD domain-containing protein, partial [Methylococcales symbiont of Iophon sp. n. MRB-2018]
MLKTDITRLIITTMLLLLASGFLFSTASQASSHDSFNTVWQMPSADLTLTFPSEGSYTIDWGDDTAAEDITSNNPTHTYTTAGDYIVTATNAITRFNLNDGEDKEKLIEIQQWGTANWTTMARAFFGASNMTMTANDTPNLAGVTNTANMFRDTSAFN